MKPHIPVCHGNKADLDRTKITLLYEGEQYRYIVTLYPAHAVAPKKDGLAPVRGPIHPFNSGASNFHPIPLRMGLLAIELLCFPAELWLLLASPSCPWMAKLPSLIRI